MMPFGCVFWLTAERGTLGRLDVESNKRFGLEPERPAGTDGESGPESRAPPQAGTANLEPPTGHALLILTSFSPSGAVSG